MHQETLLKIDKLTKSFGGVKALSDISFDLFKGEILGIIGPNGSGKTTLVNLITGFLRPDSGKIFFENKEITGFPPYKIADLGIARTFHRDISWPPTWTQAKEIYLKEYWMAGGCNSLLFPLDVLHADSMVNPGPKGAREFLAQSGEHKDPYIRCVEYATLRVRYYLARVKEKPARLKYLCGWIDRTLDFLERAVITKWSLLGS